MIRQCFFSFPKQSQILRPLLQDGSRFFNCFVYGNPALQSNMVESNSSLSTKEYDAIVKDNITGINKTYKFSKVTGTYNRKSSVTNKKQTTRCKLSSNKLEIILDYIGQIYVLFHFRKIYFPQYFRTCDTAVIRFLNVYQTYQIWISPTEKNR